MICARSPFWKLTKGSSVRFSACRVSESHQSAAAIEAITDLRIEDRFRIGLAEAAAGRDADEFGEEFASGNDG